MDLPRLLTGECEVIRDKVYLGDSVYAAIDETGRLVLTTENGLGPTNTIVMEPEVVVALEGYVASRSGESE
jgi:hypothetical protein